MSIADRTEEKNKRGVTTYDPNGGSTGFDYDNPKATIEWLAGLINPKGTSLISSGGTGTKVSDVLAKRKYEDELAKERRTIQAYQQMLSGGGYRSGMDQLLGMIDAQGKTTSTNVEDTYRRALENIAAGYDTAQGLTTKGYDALGEYLRANPNNPYANVQVSAGAAPDAMEQLLSAYGVSAEPVRAQVAAEQQAAQQGAAGFQNLLNVLGASAQQSDASRLAEMMMAQNLAGETLGAQRATFRSQAEQAQANALAQIQAQLAQARLEQEGAAVSRRQKIEDAIAAAGGVVPSNSGDGSKKDEGKPPARLVDMLADRAKSANPTLKKRIEEFVKKNPNAGMKKIEKEFPKIAATLKG